MKIKTLITLALITLATVVNAAELGNGTISIKVTKASKTLVEQWVNAYMCTNPNVKVQFVDKAEDADLSITTSSQQSDAAGSTFVARFALLPVTATDNPLIKDIVGKQWSEKDIKRLFFQTEDELFEDKADRSKKERLTDKLTVFSGNSSTSASTVFAEHFGFKKGDIRGKRIQGDDLFLLNAIQKDKQSVTFNSTANLYDTASRQLKSNIAILPLDLKKDQEQILLSGNLDETLRLLEESNISTIPVEKIGFTYSSFNTDIEQFLAWVVSEGQQYNNQAGYLKLGTKDQKQQLALLASK